LAETDEIPTPRKSKGQRFLEPRRFSPAQRQHLLQTLSDHHIGDEESRILFLAAIEYDLASCKIPETAPLAEVVVNPAPEAAPLPTDPVLEELALLAGTLAKSLATLDDHQRQGLRQRLEATDCFARGHGEAYFALLQLELEHLAAASLPLAEFPLTSPPLPARPAAPVLDPAWRDFLARIASAFADCFEIEPRGEPGSPFPLALAALSKVSGLALPLDPEALEGVLHPQPLK